MKKAVIPSSVLVAVVLTIVFIAGHNNNSPTNTNQNNISSQQSSSNRFKDGIYKGNETTNIFGPVQVQVTVQNGKVSDISFLQLPGDNPHSQMVSSEASPILKQEAISAQNANIDIVSGATQTSEAFQQSLSSALSKASKA